VSQLEALQAVAALGFLAQHLQHGIDQLGALCVMALGPVVACDINKMLLQCNIY